MGVEKRYTLSPFGGDCDGVGPPGGHCWSQEEKAALETGSPDGNQMKKTAYQAEG